MKNICALPFLLIFFFTGCTQSEESKIKDTCNRFIEGRIALDRGDSLIIKSVTDDSLFKLVMLNQQFLNNAHVPVIGPDLNIYPKSVVITGNCATCLMSGMEYYEINLCKDGNVWKVKGENGNFPTSEKIASARKKLIDAKIFSKEKPARDSVFIIVNSFFDNAKLYFKGGQLDSLKKTCTTASADFIQRLYAYAKKRTGSVVLLEEMERPNYLSGDVKFENDKVVFKFYNEETSIMLQKTGNSYIITGFNGIDSKYINEKIIKEQYVNFLRALKLIRQKEYRNKIFN